MPNLLARSAAIACFLLLAACSGLKPPPDVDAAARLSFEQLREGNDAAPLARATPEIRATDPAALAQMRATLPPGKPSSSKAVAWNVWREQGATAPPWNTSTNTETPPWWPRQR